MCDRSCFHGIIKSDKPIQRYLKSKPIVAFGLTLQASWEGAAVTFQASLLNGGPVSMIYGLVLAGLGSSALALSLGEMASMYV